jgi:hypothetical protein
MSSNFVFFNATQARNNSPKITIRRNGVIVMNAGAVKGMVNGSDEEVTYVKVAYDKEKRAIGIVPATADDIGKFRLRHQNKGTSRIINAKRLFEHYGITVEQATSYDVEDFGDGLFGVTLSEDSQAQNDGTASSKRKARSS